MAKRTCTATGCERSYYALGYCAMHYKRTKATGSPYSQHPSARECFVAKISIQSDGCWLWTGAKVKEGYGRFNPDGLTIGAHVFALREFRGIVLPPSGHVDHTCHVTLCVNPDHLRPATAKQNGENRGHPNSNNTSGVRGVYWDRDRKRWHAQVKHNRKAYFVGRFVSKKEAEAAVVEFRNRLFTHNDLDRAS